VPIEGSRNMLFIADIPAKQASQHGCQPVARKKPSNHLWHAAMGSFMIKGVAFEAWA
jgi:hypothetical protein